MFNVVRTIPAPASLAAQRDYKGQDVVNALRTMFHSKCYLCEQDSIANPEVEHFIPHNKQPNLMYGWDNLFYACRRCNSIKSNTHVNLLNATDSNVDVFEEIIHFAGNAAVGEIQIVPSSEEPSQETINTAHLIWRCFNESNTSLRDISKESLLESLLDEFSEFLRLRNEMVSKRSIPAVVENAKSRLAMMCSISYPFSVFWKWHILKDIVIDKKFPQIRNELGF